MVVGVVVVVVGVVQVGEVEGRQRQEALQDEVEGEAEAGDVGAPAFLRFRVRGERGAGVQGPVLEEGEGGDVERVVVWIDWVVDVEGGGGVVWWW